jgi:hypothetical protein
VNQAAVSKLERRADMYVSALQSFVKAMGGELKITARFPEGTVEINQFEDVKKAAGSTQQAKTGLLERSGLKFRGTHLSKSRKVGQPAARLSAALSRLRLRRWRSPPFKVKSKSGGFPHFSQKAREMGYADVGRPPSTLYCRGNLVN